LNWMEAGWLRRWGVYRVDDVSNLLHEARAKAVVKAKLVSVSARAQLVAGTAQGWKNTN